MKNFELLNLKPGDALIRNKSAIGIVDHYGVYVGHNQVIDNHPERGVQMISLSEFLNGRKLTNIKRFPGQPMERNYVVERAHSLIGKSYDLFSFNCEHLVSISWDLEKKSHQVSFWSWVMVILLTAFLIDGSNG